jgi:hypothetical protein
VYSLKNQYKNNIIKNNIIQIGYITSFGTSDDWYEKLTDIIHSEDTNIKVDYIYSKIPFIKMSKTLHFSHMS